MSQIPYITLPSTWINSNQREARWSRLTVGVGRKEQAEGASAVVNEIAYIIIFN